MKIIQAELMEKCTGLLRHLAAFLTTTHWLCTNCCDLDVAWQACSSKYCSPVPSDLKRWHSLPASGLHAVPRVFCDAWPCCATDETARGRARSERYPAQAPRGCLSMPKRKGARFCFAAYRSIDASLNAAHAVSGRVLSQKVNKMVKILIWQYRSCPLSCNTVTTRASLLRRCAKHLLLTYGFANASAVKVEAPRAAQHVVPHRCRAIKFYQNHSNSAYS